MGEGSYFDFSERFENTSTERVAEQFLEHETEEIEIQHPVEIYSIFKELDNCSETEKDILMSHIDVYADDIPVETDGGSLTPDEIAEYIREETEKWSSNYDYSKSFIRKQTSTLLGDRLRYFDQSTHSK